MATQPNTPDPSPNHAEEPAGEGVRSTGAAGAGAGYGGSQNMSADPAATDKPGTTSGGSTKTVDLEPGTTANDDTDATAGASGVRRESASNHSGMRGAGSMGGTHSNARDGDSTDGNATGQRM